MPANRGWPPANDREFEFIRLALASRIFPNQFFPDPPNNLDWDRLYTLLRQHRLSAHFYVLGKPKRNDWPASFRERLKLDRYSQIIYSEKFKLRIKPVMAGLLEANIPVIVLKGWALMQTIYGGDNGQRFFDDIDILVHPMDVDPSEEILKKLGWHARGERRPGFIRCYYNAHPYYYFEKVRNTRNVYSVGFHWGLLHHPAYNPQQINIQELFERAHPLKIAEVPIFEMSIEDHLVYNCAHIVLQHRSEESLLRYYEIAAVIRDAQSTLDWQKVEECAKNWRLVLPLKSVLTKIEEFWPGIVPAWAITLIDGIKPTLSERFIHTWYKRTNYNPSLEHLLTWLTMSGIKRRFLFIWEDIFPNPMHMAREYSPAPGSFLLLSYFRRIIRVLGYIWK
jgi:hypothetical protein